MYIDIKNDKLELIINNYKKEPDNDIFNYFKKDKKYFSLYPKNIGLYRYITDNNNKNIIEIISNYKKCYNKILENINVNVNNNNSLLKFLKLKATNEINLKAIGELKKNQDLSLYQYIYYIEEKSLKNIPGTVNEEKLKKIIKPIKASNKNSRNLSSYIIANIKAYYIALLEYDIIKPLNELDIDDKYKKEVYKEFTLIYE